MESQEMGIVNAQTPLKFTKLRICKNLATVSSAFLLLFTAFNGLSFLQSTMNKKEGIGIMSQAAVFAGFCLASLVLPKYCVKKLGCKSSLLVGIFLFLPYIVSNFYPAWGTLIPTGLFCGVGASIIYSSQSTYYNISSFLYCTAAKGISMDDPKNTTTTTSTCTSVEEFTLELAPNNTVLSSPNFHPDSKSTTQSSDGRLCPRSNSQELCVRATKNNVPDPVTMTHFKMRSSDHEQGFFPPMKVMEVSNIKACQSNIAPNKEISEEKLETKKTIEKIQPLFFGFHGLMFNSSLIWCNLMSYFLLRNDDILSNITSNMTQNFSCACGASFCNDRSNCNEDLIAEPTLEMRYILAGISVVLALLAFSLILLFLDKLDSDKEPTAFSLSIILATFNHGKNIKQILLAPLMVFYGMEQAFYIGDYTKTGTVGTFFFLGLLKMLPVTLKEENRGMLDIFSEFIGGTRSKSFIACAMGTYNVGLVTIFFGFTSALSSTLSGWTVRLLGRVPIFITGEIINVGTCIYFLWWTPNPNEPYMFFLGALLWGSFTGLFSSQLPALTGILFKENEEAAFGFYYLCMSLGFSAMFVISDQICTNYKIYILLVMSTAGIIGYLITEYLHYSKKEM